MPETGGAPEELTTLDPQKGELAHTWPARLPRPDAILFTIETEGTSFDDSKIAVLSLETGAIQVVLERAYKARYTPSGHLVFARQQALWAVPFDVDRLETTGPEVLVVPDVQSSASTGWVPYSFSEDGLLVYAAGGEIGGGGQDLVRVDRDGNQETITQEPAFWGVPRISPDGSQIAVTVGLSATDLWIYPVNGDPPYRLTVDANARRPVWSPDGERLAYASLAELLVLPADGSAREPEILLQRDSVLPSPYSWSPDGTEILFYEETEGTGWDIWVKPLDGEPRSFLQTEFYEGQPVFSTDGRFVAYVVHPNWRAGDLLAALSRTGSAGAGLQKRRAATGVGSRRKRALLRERR